MQRDYPAQAAAPGGPRDDNQIAQATAPARDNTSLRRGRDNTSLRRGWEPAVHATLDDHTPYLVGPLARYALSGASLSPLAREAAQMAGLTGVCRNPFQSIIAGDPVSLL